MTSDEKGTRMLRWCGNGIVVGTGVDLGLDWLVWRISSLVGIKVTAMIGLGCSCFWLLPRALRLNAGFGAAI